MMDHTPNPTQYYVPENTHWPIVGCIGLFTLVIGGVNWIHENTLGPYLFFAGALILAYMMFGWCSLVSHESRTGLLNAQRDRSYCWGMVWFIFSEIMFFGA